jgi:hypothetical protein
LKAIDYQFVEGGGRHTRPEFKRLPSEYFADHIYVTFWFEQFAVRELVGRAIPASNVMFETDFQHPTCPYGDIEARLEASLTGDGESIRRQLVWDHAVTLYGLDALDRV